MKIQRIFADDDGEGLYAMVYDGETKDEFERLFDLWDDAQYVLQYLKQNSAYLNHAYFDGTEIDDVAQKVAHEAEELEILLEEYFFDADKTLQMLFVPLGNQARIPHHQKTKARIRNPRAFPKPVLRLYAIRISANSFVITGGAIKLVHAMEDHPDTVRELEKLDVAKKFLHDSGFNNVEDLEIVL